MSSLPHRTPQPAYWQCPAKDSNGSSPNSPGQNNTIVSRGQSIGLVFPAEAALLSFGAVLLLFAVVIRNIYRHSVRRRKTRWWQHINSPLQVYMLSLFVADLIQGVGILFDIRWIVQGAVTCGTYCTAQGVIQQLGETTVAMSTLAIAVHTFIIVFFRRGNQAVLFATLIVGLIWSYVIIFVAVSVNAHPDFDVPTPYWCWVGRYYNPERVAGEYAWFWSTALVSIVLYVILFFTLRGNIELGQNWWKIHFHTQPTAKSQEVSDQASQTSENKPQGSREAAKQTFIMLLYPACYVILIVPQSIVRFIHIDIVEDSPAIFFAQTLFALSGVVNVTLFLRTRRGLLGELSDLPSHVEAFDSSESVSVSVPRTRATELQPVNNPDPIRDPGGENVTL